MKRALGEGFPLFLDEPSLRSAIELVCTDFGTVAHLDIMPAFLGPPLQCPCFLQLGSAAAEAELIAKFHLIPVGDKLGFYALVHEKWSGERM